MLTCIVNHMLKLCLQYFVKILLIDNKWIVTLWGLWGHDSGTWFQERVMYMCMCLVKREDNQCLFKTSPENFTVKSETDAKVLKLMQKKAYKII